MGQIIIRGAEENNLKGVDVCIPHNKLTVITGVSGSGKSSLVYDVLNREGQRMYFETFSSYTRSRLGKIRPAKVASIEGMLPVVSVGQTQVQANRRSTAGTFSEISPLLRQLFSRFNDQGLALNRNAFSFKSDKGWCPHCKGLGIEEFIDIGKLIANPNLSLRQGALVITLPNGYTIYSQVTIDELNKVCQHYGFSVDTPWKDLSDDQRAIILNGSDKVKVLYGKHSLESRLKWTGITARLREEGYYKGIIPVMEDILRRDRNDNILRFMSDRECPACQGKRLNSESLGVTWNGQTYHDYESLPIRDLYERIRIRKSTQQAESALLSTIASRLNMLCRLSVGHIACNRLSETLSQGELRRMRLAQLNHSGLTGVLYLFDEPSIGLHQRDTHTLIDTMYSLVKQGNTVVVVEHNEQVIRSAHHLIELGPGAGSMGGNLVYNGTVSAMIDNKDLGSPTRTMLTNGFASFDKSAAEKPEDFETFDVYIQCKHNIVNQTFSFARRALNVITGVSGAGKSTLVNYGLLKVDGFKQVIHVDQKPIGRTSRSNAATYTGLLDVLRKIFAQSADAKSANLTASHFTFNGKQGQCEACLGTGVVKTGMHIFEDMVQPCSVCGGTRYNAEVIKVMVEGLNIAQVLELSVSQALQHFSNTPSLLPYLQALEKLGLGYLLLGQSSTTLSGGEAQRVKLASALCQSPKGRCLYILDEPTTGLHAKDIKKLIDALHAFTANGHTVVVVEHDTQLIASADWIVDIGPEGGNDGGKSLFCGSTQQFFTSHSSPTTQAIGKKQEYYYAEVKSASPAIHLQDIYTNNLKHIDLHIDAGQLVAFTGVSGSGKTSLLMQTLHAEGQRLFTENISGFRRLQMRLNTSGQIGKVLSMLPTVAIEADTPRPDVQSTVASASGIYDLLRLLYARFAQNPDGRNLTAADFSLVNEHSVCKVCEGTGHIKRCSLERVIANPNQPLLEGALSAHKTVQYFVDEKNKFRWLLLAMLQQNGIDITKPWSDLGVDEKEMILWGTGGEEYKAQWEFKRKGSEASHSFTGNWGGLCRLIEEEYRTHFPSAKGMSALELLTDIPCTECNGHRLRPELLKYAFNGLSIGQVLEQPIDELLKQTKQSAYGQVSQPLVMQLREKLEFLSKAGLGYLTLGRPAAWLSSGELKWIQLGGVLSSHQSGMCIILDEPTWGMDSKSREHLVHTLKQAQQRGNTILVSDHRPEIISVADRVIELGPGAGEAGGKIVADIHPREIDSYKSPVAARIVCEGDRFVREKLSLHGVEPIPQIKSATIYPQRINLITGSIGSGKTQLLGRIAMECEHQDALRLIRATNRLPQANSQSAVATRTGLMSDLKRAFAATPEAIAKGIAEADFGFNSKKSQCPRCKGLGFVTITLDFLPDVKEVCPECNGQRYKDEWLTYHVEGKTLSQWLGVSVNEAYGANFISSKSKKMLLQLQLVGLGYLTVGQEISTLSHGERRRLMLAESIAGLKREPAIILFDSPTRGLDWANTQKLFQLFDRLIREGHTIVIADSQEVEPLADYVGLRKSKV